MLNRKTQSAIRKFKDTTGQYAKRVGGGVQDFDAIKLLKFGAS